jgi:hypothetical protein
VWRAKNRCQETSWVPAFSHGVEGHSGELLDRATARMVKILKRVETEELEAFHKLTSNGLLRLRNSICNFAFTGL